LAQILSTIEEVWYPYSVSYLLLKVDIHAIEQLQLDISLNTITKAIKRLKGFKDEIQTASYGSHIRVYLEESGKGKKRVASKSADERFGRMLDLKRTLPNVVIRGYPEANRAIIKKNDAPNAKGVEEVSLLVEGYGLKACMNTEGVDGHATRTNSVLETFDVLGIEAARKTIIDEIGSVMSQMDIDPRHMALLADVMTSKGEILGITRFGLAKMRDSVLQLASFEKTPDHLFEAAFRMKKDKIEGVSECIIMGQSIGLGTGASKVLRRLALTEADLQEKETLFEDCYKDMLASRND
jgi:DNA-directed RNA polymerase III subunit RPC1